MWLPWRCRKGLGFRLRVPDIDVCVWGGIAGSLRGLAKGMGPSRCVCVWRSGSAHAKTHWRLDRRSAVWRCVRVLVPLS